MKKPIVLINGKVQEEIVPALEPYFEIHQWKKEGIMPLDVLEQEIPSADALILAYTSTLPSNIIEKGTNLKIIAQHFVGYENVDVDACTKANIPFCNTASASIDTVAELAISLMFASSRHIVDCAQYVRNGEWIKNNSYDFLSGFDIKGSTIGILGMGKVGFSIANKAQALGMNILYNNRHRRPDVENNTLNFADLDTLYKQSDVIMNVLPSNDSTHHFINLSSFKKMKPTALFINVGRGDTVVTDDLITALKEKYIAQVALDVIEEEPISADHPILKMPNVIITPHIGSCTEQTRLRKSQITIQNILNCFAHKPLIDCVNAKYLK